MGDEIRIGPYKLIFESTQLAQYDESNYIRIDALNLQLLELMNERGINVPVVLVLDVDVLVLLLVPLVLLAEVPPDPPPPPDASTPTTLKVTVNGSFAGLLNLKFRLNELSPPVSMLSLPTAPL